MKNKKNLANYIMAAIIAVIVIGGILTALNLRGAFDSKDNTKNVYVNQMKGLAAVTRDGVTFDIEAGSVLRNGDIIETDSKSRVSISVLSGEIEVAPDSRLTIENARSKEFLAKLEQGEIFVNAADKMSIEWMGTKQDVEKTLASFDVRTGSGTCCVYAGKVSDAFAGNAIYYVGEEREISPFGIDKLNEFEIYMLKYTDTDLKLCFDIADVKAVESSREEEMEVIGADGETDTKTTEDVTTSKTTEESTQTASQQATEDTTQKNTEKVTEKTTDKATEKATEKTTNKTTDKTTDKVTQRVTEKVTNKTTEQTTEKVTQKVTEKVTDKTTEQIYTCTIRISCESILDSLDELKAGKDRYVPDDGIIMKTVTVKFTDGESVFDVLKRACDSKKVQLEYAYTPMYDSYYVEGIGNIYERDCGSLSGWTYKVNGWFANYGCSEYKLKDGDVITWDFSKDITR